MNLFNAIFEKCHFIEIRKITSFFYNIFSDSGAENFQPFPSNSAYDIDAIFEIGKFHYFSAEEYDFVLFHLAKDCGIPSLEYANGYVIKETESSINTRYGSVLKVGCSVGWEWNNSSFKDDILEIQCNENENWTVIQSICQRMKKSTFAILLFNSKLS